MNIMQILRYVTIGGTSIFFNKSTILELIKLPIWLPGKFPQQLSKTGFKAEAAAFILGGGDAELMCADKLFMCVFAFPLEELGWW